MFQSIETEFNFITKIRWRADYTGKGCFVDAFLRFDEELNGSRYGISSYADGALGRGVLLYRLGVPENDGGTGV